MKILVVEDNEITRKLVRAALRASTYEVIEAADGATALALAARERPDLILQDLRLPDMDGLDLVRRLRELPGFAEVPVLAVSGFLPRLEEAKAMTGGFNDFLVKPVQPADLIRAIEAHLPRTATAAGRPGAGCRLVLADDDPIQLKLARIRLELDGFTVLTARDGIEALEAARSGAVDAIVSDVLMPRLDGFGLCQAVRGDPALAGLRVVLCSNTYLDREDEALARKMGADAFVLRTPDLVAVREAVLAHDLPPAAPAPGVAGALRERHLYRLVSQLERQAILNAGLSQRVASQSAALSILSTISDTLAKSLESPLQVDEILARCLEAGGFSVGVLYLLDADGRLVVRAHSGYHAASLTALDTLFGHEPLFRAALDTGAPIAIPSPAVDADTAAAFLSRTGPASVLIMPILFREERLGALLVATDLRDLNGEESLSFARTLGNQIGQVIALRQAFNQMAAAEQQYRGIFEHAVEGIFRATPEGRYLLVNPAMARIFGYASPEELVASITNIGAQMYADPAQRREILDVLARDGAVFRYECQARRRDGTIIWVSQSVRAVRDDEGRVQFYEGLLENISERRNAEAITAGLASTARALLESLDAAVVSRVITDHVCQLLHARSAAVYRLEPGTGDLLAMGQSEAGTHAFYWTTRLAAGTGLTGLAVMQGRPLAEPDILLSPHVRFAAESRAQVERTDRAVVAVPLRVGDQIFGALAIRDRTGRVFDAGEIRLAQAFADQAAIALHHARLYEELRAGRDFLASVTQNSADGILTADVEGRITFFSQGAEAIWGRASDEVLGRPLTDLLGESDQMCSVLASLGGAPVTQSHETTVHERTGRAVELSVSLAPMRDSAGTVTGVVAVARDITERKRTEAALRQSEKLAAMSSLVAGVAHELNNPLAIILAHSTLMMQGAPGSAEERARKITQSAERCARLVKNFLALARQHPPERTVVDLEQLVRETIELVTYPLRADGVDVELDFEPGLPPLWADGHQLQQVILNLVTNAHHAVRTIAGPRRISVRTRSAPDGHVKVSIADSGPGIPVAVQDRLFEPFFTTKPEGQGTGLGLSLCRGIVESHGGTLHAQSPAGGGAVLTVELPITTAPVMTAPAADAAPVRASRALKILVVEDEPGVAEILVDMLALEGHHADVAPNGLVALERLRAGAYDALISDLRMPELNGPQLYRRLEADGHPIVRRFMFVTGDVLGPETREFLAQCGVPMVPKPFVLDEVRNALRALMARG